LLFYFAHDGLKEEQWIPSGYSVGKDLLLMSLAEQIDVENVHLSRSAVVSYKGYKMVAKTIPNSVISAHRELNNISDILAGESKVQTD
jgi:hypothetical protein